MTRVFGLAVALLVTAAGLVSSACPGEPPPPDKPATLSGIRDDIFQVSCSATVCHGGAGAADGLELIEKPFENLVDVDSVEVPGKKRVVAGDPDNSLLFLVLKGNVGTLEQMPKGLPDGLPDDEITRIKTWIADGAENN